MPMEKIGLVEKATSERDARVSLVRITSAGETIFSDASTTFEQTTERLLKNIEGRKAETFLALLHSI